MEATFLFLFFYRRWRGLKGGKGLVLISRSVGGVTIDQTGSRRSSSRRWWWSMPRRSAGGRLAWAREAERGVRGRAPLTSLWRRRRRQGGDSRRRRAVLL